ncbi:hypothetical protein COCOBI_03-3750 [Coccomyxa sp. Obi]|nr:hypothetical protein COCOBI_03-3750 [Coccomyxa sp. Obi]
MSRLGSAAAGGSSGLDAGDELEKRPLLQEGRQGIEWDQPLLGATSEGLLGDNPSDFLATIPSKELGPDQKAMALKRAFHGVSFAAAKKALDATRNDYDKAAELLAAPALRAFVIRHPEVPIDLLLEVYHAAGRDAKHLPEIMENLGFGEDGIDVSIISPWTSHPTGVEGTTSPAASSKAASTTTSSGGTASSKAASSPVEWVGWCKFKSPSRALRTTPIGASSPPAVGSDVAPGAASGSSGKGSKGGGSSGLEPMEESPQPPCMTPSTSLSPVSAPSRVRIGLLSPQKSPHASGAAASKRTTPSTGKSSTARQAASGNSKGAPASTSPTADDGDEVEEDEAEDNDDDDGYGDGGAYDEVDGEDVNGNDYDEDDGEDKREEQEEEEQQDPVEQALRIDVQGLGITVQDIVRRIINQTTHRPDGQMFIRRMLPIISKEEGEGKVVDEQGVINLDMLRLGTLRTICLFLELGQGDLSLEQCVTPEELERVVKKLETLVAIYSKAGLPQSMMNVISAYNTNWSAFELCVSDLDPLLDHMSSTPPLCMLPFGYEFFQKFSTVFSQYTADESGGLYDIITADIYFKNFPGDEESVIDVP